MNADKRGWRELRGQRLNMKSPPGALIVVFDFSNVPEDEFNDWYDTEHLAERLRVKGFIGGQRWLAADRPHLSVVTYDVEHAGVLSSPDYMAVSGEGFSPWTKRINRKCRLLARYVAEQLSPGDRVAPEHAGGLLLLALNVEPEAEPEFNRWNDTEHVPRLAAVPGVIAARRYRCIEGPHRYLALYHVAAPEVIDSPAWASARETPWTLEMRARTRDRLRVVCRRYHRTG